MVKVVPQDLAGLPIFSGLAPKVVEEFLARSRSILHPKGAHVFTQGEPAHSVFILVAGRVKAVKLTPDGRQLVVRFVSPGEIFGVALVIGRRDYPATASAVVDSQSLAWPAGAWSKLAAKHSRLGDRMMRTVGDRLQDAHERLVQISSKQVEQRVARALLLLVQEAGRSVKQGMEIDFPISRQDVAEMTGTTLHTVSRILSNWEERGLARGGRQRIVITDPANLSALAERAED